MQQAESPKCPLCGQIDKVEKVTGIVARGTSTGRYSGPVVGGGVGVNLGGDVSVGGVYAHTTLSGEEQTELAKRLSPPAKAEEPREGCLSCLTAVFLGLVGALAIYTGLGVLMVLIMVAIGLRAGDVMDPMRLAIVAAIAVAIGAVGEKIWRMGCIWFFCVGFAALAAATVSVPFMVEIENETVGVGEALVGLAIAVVVAAAIAFVCFWGLDAIMSKEDPKKKEHEERIKKWEEDMARWEKSYYCARDDIVFIP